MTDDLVVEELNDYKIVNVKRMGWDLRDLIKNMMSFNL